MQPCLLLHREQERAQLKLKIPSARWSSITWSTWSTGYSQFLPTLSSRAPRRDNEDEAASEQLLNRLPHGSSEHPPEFSPSSCALHERRLGIWKATKLPDHSGGASEVRLNLQFCQIIVCIISGSLHPKVCTPRLEWTKQAHADPDHLPVSQPRRISILRVMLLLNIETSSAKLRKRRALQSPKRPKRPKRKVSQMKNYVSVLIIQSMHVCVCVNVLIVLNRTYCRKSQFLDNGTPLHCRLQRKHVDTMATDGALKNI